MPIYRLHGSDGTTQTITAARVVVVDEEVRFQSSNGDGWAAVAVAPLTDVQQVQRRFNEADGRVRWKEEREVSEAAAALRPDEPDEQPAAEGAEPEQAPALAAGPVEAVPQAPSAVTPPPVVSAREVRCPACGEEEELSGRRTDGDIVLTCHSCGYVGPRVAERRCETCGGTDVVSRPRALVERARGTQLSVVGYSSIGLCRTCDADELEYSQHHNATGVLPKELPTVDPRTLGQTRPTAAAERRPLARRHEP